MFGLTAILIILAILVGLVGFAASIWLVAIAFRRSALWGLGVLFVPFVGLVYAIKFWDEARKPFLIGLGSGVAAGVLFMTTVFTGATAVSNRLSHDLSEGMAKDLSAQTPKMNQRGGSTEPAATENRSLESSAPLRAAPAGRIAETRTDVASALPQDPDVFPARNAKEAANRRPAPPYDPDRVTDDGFAPLALRDSSWAVGRAVKIVARSGQTHRGQLLGVGPKGYELEQTFGGGTVRVEFRDSEIEALWVKAEAPAQLP
jgi:hypothetical protein